MNVLIRRACVERRIGGIAADSIERVDDPPALLGAEDADPFQRAREGLRAPDVRVDQTPVEIERAGEALEDFGRAGFEAAASEFHFDSRAPAASARTFMGRPIRLIKPSASF